MADDMMALLGLTEKSADADLLLEQNDEWAVQRCRYMTRESVSALGDDPLVSLPILAA
ncbi:hypothetical protein KXR53_16985 [Inquilinus limosus]|uniref:hypothetical protein n=1 Tax=Inquilinus limosus TaxID=171674 RepID=UPI003F143587